MGKESIGGVKTSPYNTSCVIPTQWYWSFMEGVEWVIAFSSFSWTPEQRNYCTTRKEFIAIVRFTRQFRYYLLGRVFTGRTDHSSLTWLLRFKEPQGQLARWIEEISQYNRVVNIVQGLSTGMRTRSRVPDPLVPCSAYLAGIGPANLPCGGCHYCTKAHPQCAKFTADVGEAARLTAYGDSAPIPGGPPRVAVAGIRDKSETEGRFFLRVLSLSGSYWWTGEGCRVQWISWQVIRVFQIVFQGEG